MEAETAQVRRPSVAAPVFVLAPARSYSSIVTQVLGSHPQLYAFPELMLSTCDTVGQWLDAVPRSGRGRESWASGLLRSLGQLSFGGQTEAAIAAAWAYLAARRDWPAHAIFDELLEAVAPLVGVEKSPATAASHTAMRRLLRWYPDARFIELRRHPVATCESMRAAYAPGWDPTLGDLERSIPYSVIAQRRRIRAFLDELPADRWRAVCAEDVVDDPSSALVPVLTWLGLRTDAQARAALRHPERSPYARTGPPGARAGNDPGFQRDPVLRAARRPGSLDLPAAWRVSPCWRDELQRLGRELGYAGA